MSTRYERILSGEDLEPISREEHFLAKLAGKNVETPEPISRKEHFLQDIIDSGLGGGNGGGTIVTEDITITPTTEKQVVNRSSGKYINKVTVNSIPSEYIVPSGNLDITENDEYDVREVEKVIVNVTSEEIELQEKSVTPTKETQSVTPDSGYNGLSKVSVGAIPSEYITPTGTKSITENGIHTVTEYENVVVDVPSEEPNLITKEITENGTYNASDDGADGYSSVSVNVASSGGGGADSSSKLKSLSYFCGRNDTYSAVVDLRDNINAVLDPNFDASNATIAANMFKYNNDSYSGIKTIPPLNTCKVTNTFSMFFECSYLHTVEGIDMINVTNCINMFLGCVRLTNLTLKNIKKSGLIIGSGTSYGHLLTVDSLVNTIKELWAYTSGSYTLTMGTANTAKLTDVYVKLITPTEEQIANDPYINNKMPCEVCASTDEGAMLITDYAVLKNWTIT